MKKLLYLTIIALVLTLCSPVAAFADDTSRAYRFGLTSNGTDVVDSFQGETITVSLTLERTDSTESYDMYAMQSEIQYDADFFRFVEGSEMLGRGIESVNLEMRDNHGRVYMNYLSTSGGTTWAADFFVGSFQLEVIAESGVSEVVCEDYLVSTYDGKDKYQAYAANLTVAISTDCTVRFVTNGGTPVPDQIVYYGEKIIKPEDPTRDDIFFAGWYKNLDLTDEWDFENDVVKGNMVLYAKWSEEMILDEDNPLASFEMSAWYWLLIIIIVALVVAIILLQRKRRKDEQKTKEEPRT